MLPLNAHLTSGIVTDITETGQEKSNCQTYTKTKDVSTVCKGIKKTGHKTQYLV